MTLPTMTLSMMKRRDFLVNVAAAAIAPPPQLPRPTPAQLDWQNFELGMVFHYDLPVFAAQGWSEMKGTLDPNLYQPHKLDTDQWVAAAQAMGCRYALFTATHFNGFLQWQSDLYPYGLKQTSWRGGKADVFGDFVKSCRRAGIAPGVYLSCHRNAWQKVWGHKVDWGAGGAAQAQFARIGERMTEELVSRYGPLCEIWYDAGLLHPRDGGPDVTPIVDRHQKRIVFYHSPQRREHRWIGNESGFAGYPCWATMPDLEAAEAAHKNSTKQRAMLLHGDPNGKLWSPGMVDIPGREHEWFWRPGDEAKVQPLEKCIKNYYESVGRNCTYIIGGTPDRDGLIPDADFRLYSEFGKEIRRRFSQPLVATRGTGTTLELRLPKPARFDHVVLAEDIAHGERVREYTVEALRPGNQWEKVTSGTAIGHKRIEQVPAAEAARLRLLITQSTAPPIIRNFAAYYAA